MLGVLLYVSLGGEWRFDRRDWLTLAILVNGAHFMGSYRVLYSSKEHILSHRWSTIGIPALLAPLVVASVVVEDPTSIGIPLFWISTVYLAWHYSGQTWGMIATHARVAGVSFTDRERQLLRSGPRILLAIHVLCVIPNYTPPAEWIAPETWQELFDVTLAILCMIAAVTVGAGLWVMRQVGRRGRALPRRAILTWAGYYVWYPFWILVPGGIFWVQNAHALQYLSFPLRVDVNRFDAAHRRSSLSRLRRVLSTYSYLVVWGAILMFAPMLLVTTVGEGWYTTPRVLQVSGILSSAIAIHHYFVDGAIWHLRDAAVRRSLFAHLEESDHDKTIALHS